jgi:hypothetical protein
MTEETLENMRKRTIPARRYKMIFKEQTKTVAHGKSFAQTGQGRQDKLRSCRFFSYFCPLAKPI